jgi:hypothetical protein
MGLRYAAVAVLVFAAASGRSAHAQCMENNYIHDGAPSAQLDCQPLAELKQLSPDEMSETDRQLVASRHADLQEAARFFGFDPDAPGWSYKQSVSPLLSKHVLLSFTNATPATRASHFMAVVPSSSNEKVQLVPAFARGLRPFKPGWQTKGSYAVFNRLLNSERGARPISRNSDWIDYAVLYLALIGRIPTVPTESDSIQANWNLTVKHGTTPVISVAKDGAATIAFSDLSETERVADWKLAFDKQGQIMSAERQERYPQKVWHISTENGTSDQAAAQPQ